MRWWRLEGKPQLRALAFEWWDPLGLAGIVPDDEYDAYLDVLASKLKRGMSRADVVSYLTQTLSEDDSPSASMWGEKCERAADVFIDWYRRSNAPR